MQSGEQVELTAPPAPGQRIAGAFFCIFGASGVLGALVDPSARAPGGLTAALFGMVGVAMMLGRRGVRIDATRTEITTWWGLWFPIGRSRHHVGGARRTAITKELRGSGRSRHWAYVVRLYSKNAPPLELAAPSDYAAARGLCEGVANVFDVGMTDDTSGVRVERDAGTLDMTHRARLRREGGRPHPGVPPPAVRVEHEGSTTVCRLPRGPLPPFIVAVGVLTVVLLVVVGMAMWFARQHDGGVASIMFGSVFLGIPIVGIYAHYGTVGAGARDVAIDPRGVRVGPGILSRHMAYDEVEELIVVPLVEEALWQKRGGSIVLRGDRRTMVAGRGLDETQLAWLEGAIAHAMAPQETGYRR